MKTFDFTVNSIEDIVNGIIIDAVMMNASDIHFDPSEKNLKVRIRIDGDLQDYTLIDNQFKNNLITRIKLLAGMNITESRLPQDGSIKSTINGKDLDLRVSTIPTNYGEKLVIRILDYYMSLEGIEALGFSKNSLEKIDKMLANPNGIILVTGATGSGKSTTVYAMLQKLNNEETNIITVEDPIEMNIEGINQIQVNPEIGLDFANVLRSILRQDPNVILIGEIRDSETARIAIRSSITGHLVLSTLHTNNSLTTIERLLDMDVERYLLSSSLKGIVSQALAKKLCPECATKRPATEAEKKLFKEVLNVEVAEVPEAGSCPKCHKGYKGRISVQEVLLIDDNIRNAINEGVPRQTLKEMIYSNNEDTIIKDGLTKVLNGITSMSEIYRLIDVDDDINNIYVRNTNNDYKKEVKPTTVINTENNNTENNKTANNKIVTENVPNIAGIDKIDELINTLGKNSPSPKTVKTLDGTSIKMFTKEEKEALENAHRKPERKNIITKPNNTPDKESATSKVDDIYKSIVNDTSYSSVPKRVTRSEDKKTNTNLESTQDIYKAILEKNNLIDKTNIDQDDDNYTDDLINLINKDLFE